MSKKKDDKPSSPKQSPILRLIEGEGQGPPLPTFEHFPCPECQADCKVTTDRRPVAVQHALPVCALWKRIEGKQDDVERFLIKAGAHLLIPQGTA